MYNAEWYRIMYVHTILNVIYVCLHLLILREWNGFQQRKLIFDMSYPTTMKLQWLKKCLKDLFAGFTLHCSINSLRMAIEWLNQQNTIYIYMYPPAMQWKNHEKPPLRDDFLIQTSILSRDFIDFLPSLINRRTFFYTPGTSQWSLGMFAVPTGLRPCKAKDCNSAKSLKLDLGWFVARLSLKMKSWHVMSKW